MGYYKNYTYTLRCTECGSKLEIKLTPEDCLTPEDVAEGRGWWKGDDGQWRCEVCDVVEEGIE